MLCWSADCNETASSKLAGPRCLARCLRRSHRVTIRTLARAAKPLVPSDCGYGTPLCQTDRCALEAIWRRDGKEGRHRESCEGDSPQINSGGDKCLRLYKKRIRRCCSKVLMFSLTSAILSVPRSTGRRT